jgi:hypothetical protein
MNIENVILSNKEIFRNHEIRFISTKAPQKLVDCFQKILSDIILMQVHFCRVPFPSRGAIFLVLCHTQTRRCKFLYFSCCLNRSVICIVEFLVYPSLVIAVR